MAKYTDTSDVKWQFQQDIELAKSILKSCVMSNFATGTHTEWFNSWVTEYGKPNYGYLVGSNLTIITYADYPSLDSIHEMIVAGRFLNAAGIQYTFANEQHELQLFFWAASEYGAKEMMERYYTTVAHDIETGVNLQLSE